MLRAGELLGVRRELAPPGVVAFREYMGESLAHLGVTDDARTIAAELFSGWGPSVLAGWALREWTAALLPDGLREAYGFGRPALAATVAGKTAQFGLRRMPAGWRRTPGFLLPPKAV
jgi:hypothetical protein